MTKFFIDKNLSKNLARGMATFGEKVIHLTDKFAEDAPDVEWLSYVGQNGLVVITRDRNIRFNTAERRAFRQYKVGAFFLGGKQLSRCLLIRQVVRNWHRMKEYDQRIQRPYMFSIPARGSKITRLSF